MKTTTFSFGTPSIRSGGILKIFVQPVAPIGGFWQCEDTGGWLPEVEPAAAAAAESHPLIYCPHDVKTLCPECVVRILGTMVQG